MENYTLYIGSNNITHKLEVKEIVKHASIAFPNGFTLQKATGYWNGTEEKTAILDILLEATDKSRAQVYSLARTLKEVLEQEAILVKIAPQNTHYNFI